MSPALGPLILGQPSAHLRKVAAFVSGCLPILNEYTILAWIIILVLWQMIIYTYLVSMPSEGGGERQLDIRYRIVRHIEIYFALPYIGWDWAG